MCTKCQIQFIDNRERIASLLKVREGYPDNVIPQIKMVFDAIKNIPDIFDFEARDESELLFISGFDEFEKIDHEKILPGISFLCRVHVSKNPRTDKPIWQIELYYPESPAFNSDPCIENMHCIIEKTNVEEITWFKKFENT